MTRRRLHVSLDLDTRHETTLRTMFAVEAVTALTHHLVRTANPHTVAWDTFTVTTYPDPSLPDRVVFTAAAFTTADTSETHP